MMGKAASWSVYDRAELRDSVSTASADGLREVLLGVDGMHCAGCAVTIERALAPLASQVHVDPAARTVQLRFDPQRAPLSALLGAIEAAGFGPKVFAQDTQLNDDRRAAREQLARIGVAVLCSMQVMMLAWPTYGASAAAIDPGIMALLRWTQWLFATPAVLYAGWPFFANAARSLRARRVDMDVPIAVSLAIAYFVSAWRVLAGSGELYFDSASMFVMLLAAARWLEGRSRATATGYLRHLLGARKLTATRVAASGDEIVALAQIARGDVLNVAPGEAVPVDGSLLDDAAELDEALLSGEARPLRREAGARLLAGSVNVGAAAFRVRAEALGHDTWLAQITAVLQRAARERPPFQQTLDRIAGGFSLLIVALAALTAVLWWPSSSEHALSAALAVLVASCPCALSLAGPLAFAAGSGRLARLGVLVARPRVLGRLGAVDTVIFDKTGTLTQTQPIVVGTEALGDATVDECLAIAAALERPFAHPIALAFRVHDRQRPVAGLQSIAGSGISGTVDGVAYTIGAVDDATSAALPTLADPAVTTIVLRRGARLLARFALRAPPRDDAIAAVAALRAQGCEVHLLTGDGEGAATALAQTVGIDQVHARMSPEGKLAHLRRLQAEGRVVMAVGDGINDAPLLAGADVACAMPQGAALAQAQADLLLIGDSLRPLTVAPALARTIRRRVLQNIGWALAYNALVLPLAMGGMLAPWMAALGMSLSSLLVVLNALRLPRVPQG